LDPPLLPLHYLQQHLVSIILLFYKGSSTTNFILFSVDNAGVAAGDNSSSSTNTGAIAGGVVGGVVGAALLGTFYKSREYFDKH
jgi:hypothetical protein